MQNYNSVFQDPRNKETCFQFKLMALTLQLQTGTKQLVMSVRSYDLETAKNMGFLRGNLTSATLNSQITDRSTVYNMCDPPCQNKFTFIGLSIWKRLSTLRPWHTPQPLNLELILNYKTC